VKTWNTETKFFPKTRSNNLRFA